MLVLPRDQHLLWLLFGLFTVILAQEDNLNPEGTGCVDPKGFLDCYSEQTKQLTSCSKAANETCADTNTHLQTCLTGCSGHHLASKIGCWLQSCWNQVYSCEYQATAAQYILGMDLVQSTVDIPFYPPPDGKLPGGCSCNIGNVVGNLSSVPQYHCMNAAQNTAPGVFAECTCCQSAFPLSNSFNACPKSDLSLFGVESDLQKVQKTMSERTPDNCAVLDSNEESAKYCADTYGVVEYAGPKVYNPLNLPEGVPGTEPLSNLPGTPFTTFASAITLALVPGYSSVITPVAFNADEVSKTQASGGAATTSRTSGTESAAPARGTTTGTTTAPSTSPTGAGDRLGVLTSGWVAVYGIICLWICLA